MIELLDEVGERLRLQDSVELRTAELESIGSAENSLARFCVGIYGPAAAEQYKRLTQTLAVFKDYPAVVVWPEIVRKEYPNSLNDRMFHERYPDFEIGTPVRRVQHSHNIRLLTNPGLPQCRIGSGYREKTKPAVLFGDISVPSPVSALHYNMFKSEYFYTSNGAERHATEQESSFDLELLEAYFARYGGMRGHTFADNDRVKLLNLSVDDQAVRSGKLIKDVWMQDMQPFALGPEWTGQVVYSKEFHLAFVCAVNRLVSLLVIAMAEKDTDTAKEINQLYRIGDKKGDLITPEQINEEQLPLHVSRAYDILNTHRSYFKKFSIYTACFGDQYRADKALGLV